MAISDYPALLASVRHCTRTGIAIPAELWQKMDELSLWDYNNALTRTVTIYINELRTLPLNQIGNFGIDFANAIEIGLNEAWWRGARENDVTEILPEWQEEIDGFIASERSHIPDFAAYLTEIANNSESTGAAVMKVRSRLDMWISRWTDVYNRARTVTAEEKTKQAWRLGSTEKHCPFCKALNGIVAYAREWEELGVFPQNPPNFALTGERNGEKGCEGWLCDCSLVPTDKRRSPKAYDRIMDIVNK